MRAGNGPTIIEAEVYRYFHQNGPFPGSAFGYRDKEEETGLARPRPADAAAPQRAAPRALHRATSSRRPPRRSRGAMGTIGDALLEPVPDGKPGQRRIKADKWPDPSFVDVGIRGDLSELERQPLRGAGRLRRRARRAQSSSTWSAT